MTDTDKTETADPTKPSKWPLVLALILGTTGTVGGFFVSYSNKVFATESPSQASDLPTEMESLAEVAFIKIPKILVSLGPRSTNKHLSFETQLEVPLQFQADVEHILPRIVDVMNSYLRALETEDFESPIILMRLRSQLLRRIQVVAGKDRVNDLLIMEFVLN
jgi:flagellar FliL protein